MKKQTAVEWLEKQINNGLSDKGLQSAIKQAKAMEKEQIIQACYDGYYSEQMMDTREYFNNTYGKHSQKKS